MQMEISCSCSCYSHAQMHKYLHKAYRSIRCGIELPLDYLIERIVHCTVLTFDATRKYWSVSHLESGIVLQLAR